MDSEEGDAFDKLIDPTEEMDVTKINASYFDQKPGTLSPPTNL